MNAIISGLVATGEQSYAVAEEQLRRAVELQQQTRHTFFSGDARLDMAHLYLAWDRPQQALAVLIPALTDLERRGMPGVVLQAGRSVIPVLRLAMEHDVLVDFASRTLVLFEERQKSQEAQPRSTPPAERTPDPKSSITLSARELEILRLLAEGLTNKEVANQLIIAPSTVKRHTINIYNKLGVNNRTQAVIQSRAQNLL